MITAEWAAGRAAPDLPSQLRAACTAANPASPAASAALHPAALSRYAPDGAWTGPQTRARIEAVLCDARIGRLLLDPHGTVLSLESLTDQIIPAQRRAVGARDRHCIAKGCTRPPAFCDVHHLTHREHGGSTSVEKDNIRLCYLPGHDGGCRVRTDQCRPERHSAGVARQLKDCLALAERKGWPVGETFIDNDVSATSGKPRPRYAAMMAALAAGRLDALVCWDVDRLTRTPRELEDVVDLAGRRGVALASVGGEIDLATQQGRLTARIKGSVAKHETEQLTRRVKAKMAERAESGAPHGRTAYGWRREQVYDDQGRRLGSRDVVHPEQAAVIRAAAAAVLAGDSLRAHVAALNDRGEVTLNDKAWTTTTLRLILLRERNAGLRVHQGEVIGRGNWEPVLDDDTFRRVVAVLTDPGRRTSPPSSAVKYLLSGIAKCGICDGPMRVLVASPGNGRTRDSYVCQHGYHVRRARLDLDNRVTRLVVGRLAMPDAAAALTSGDGEQVKQALDKAAAIRARLDLAADSYADGNIDGQQLARITGKLRPELTQWEQAARAASTAPDLLDLATADIAQRWEHLPLARRRAVIDLLLDIKVDRTTRRGGDTRFDPKSVRIRWKTT